MNAIRNLVAGWKNNQSKLPVSDRFDNVNHVDKGNSDMATPLRSFTWGTNTQGLFFLGADQHVHAMIMTRPGTGDWEPIDISAASRASTTPVFQVHSLRKLSRDIRS